MHFLYLSDICKNFNFSIFSFYKYPKIIMYCNKLIFAKDKQPKLNGGDLYRNFYYLVYFNTQQIELSRLMFKIVKLLFFERENCVFICKF